MTNFLWTNTWCLWWIDIWSHRADDKLWSRLQLDIVTIEGKQAMTAVADATGHIANSYV